MVLLCHTISAKSVDSLHIQLSGTLALEERTVLLKKLADYYLQHDLDKSLTYIEEGILLLEQHHKKALLLGKFYHLKGNVYLSKGFLINAKSAYHQAEKIFQANDNIEELTKTQINLSILYQREQKFDKAEKKYLALITRLEGMKNTFSERLLPTLYINTGSLYDDMNDSDKAIQFFYNAIQSCKGESYETIKGKALHNIAIQYIVLNRLDDAQLSIEEALRIKRKLNDSEGIVTSLNIYGNIYRIKRTFDQALPLYFEALALAKQLKSPLLLKYTYNNLYVYYEEVGDYKESINYFKKFKEVSDQLLEQDYIMKLNAFEYEYQVKQEQENLENDKKFQEYISATLFIVLLFFLVVGFLIFRYYRLSLKHSKATASKIKAEYEMTNLSQEKIKLENEKLQADISYRDRELTTNIMHLMQKYELINAVSEELMVLHDQLNGKAKKELRSIVFNLQNDNQSDVWKELEIRFEKVNQEFYDQLNHHFPKLTPNEKKLCAYLYLNLSTKDISNITHQSIKSIEVARFRLRKKLGLTNTDTDYQTFFNTLKD